MIQFLNENTCHNIMEKGSNYFMHTNWYLMIYHPDLTAGMVHCLETGILTSKWLWAQFLYPKVLLVVREQNLNFLDLC